MPTRPRQARPDGTPGQVLLATGLLVAAMGLGASASAASMADLPSLPTAGDAAASAGGTLERALRVDIDAAQRSVDVLHEHGSEGDAAQLSPARRQPVAPAAGGATSAGPRTTEAVSNRRPASPADRDADDLRPLREVLQVLREHRFWLLGLLGLVAAVMVAARLWRRRQVGASDAQLHALAERRRSSHRRRRSSRH